MPLGLAVAHGCGRPATRCVDLSDETRRGCPRPGARRHRAGHRHARRHRRRRHGPPRRRPRAPTPRRRWPSSPPAPATTSPAASACRCTTRSRRPTCVTHRHARAASTPSGTSTPTGDGTLVRRRAGCRLRLARQRAREHLALAEGADALQPRHRPRAAAVPRDPVRRDGRRACATRPGRCSSPSATGRPTAAACGSARTPSSTTGCSTSWCCTRSAPWSSSRSSPRSSPARTCGHPAVEILRGRRVTPRGGGHRRLRRRRARSPRCR